MQEGTAALRERTHAQAEVSPKGFRFFMPSTELTKAIIDQNQQLVAEYVERNFPPGYQSNQTESEDQDGSLLGRLGLETLRSESTVDTERQTRKGKQLISERLYHYLSSLAETPRALAGGEFPIWEYLPDGMATMLGLSAYRDMQQDSARAMEIRQLLEGITGEFRNWLLEEQHGRFVTPWIEIDLRNDALRLAVIEDSDAFPSSKADAFDPDLKWAVAQFTASEDTSRQTEAVSAEDDQPESAVSAR